MNYVSSLGTRKLALQAGILLALTSYVLPSVNAAEGDESSTTRVSPIVITANRTEVNTKEVSQSVEVIDKEEAKALAATDVRQALRLADNVNITKAGMTGNQLMIRGMDTQHTLLLVDGKRIAGEETAQTANVYALNRNNISNIEKIEIVRGSSSSLYGSDAIGGVVNIITKVPDEPETRIGVSTGTENQSTWLGYDTGKQGRWSASFDVRLTRVRPQNHYTYETSSVRRGPILVTTITDGVDRAYYGQQRYYDFGAVYDLENANKNKLRLGFNYFTERMRTDFADQTVVTGGRSTPTRKGYANIFRNNGYGADLTYTGETSKNTYEFRTYYNRLNKLTLYTNDIVSPLAPTGQDDAKYYTWAVEGKNTLKVNDQHKLTYGGVFQKMSYRGTRISTTGTPQEHSYNTVALYVEDLWKVTPKLLITPSVRFEHNSRFGNYTAPKLGLTYNITENTRFKANYGLGFKAPSISELYMNWHHGFVTILGNKDLQPEKSRSFDLTLEGERGNNFGKITYYNNNIKNLINTQQLAGNTYMFHNVDKAQINGFELTVGRYLTDTLTFKVSHNFIDAKDKLANTRLNNRPKSITKFILTYEENKKYGIRASLWDEFVSDYLYEGNEYTYNTLNFSISKKFNDTFSVFAGMDNILNKKVHKIFLDGHLWNIGAEWKF